MIKTQYINLNMTPSGVMPVLYCSQYDVGRPLGMVVYNGAEPVDLSWYAVTIEATRTDSTAITAAVTTSGNVGAFVTTPTMTNKADKYPAKLILADTSGKRVASLAFVMCVTPATMDENSESIAEDASLYTQYTETVLSTIAAIRSDIATERARAEAAESTLQTNLTAEVTAREAAVTAEANARTAAISAEASARQAADNTLQLNINSEAGTRASADANLQTQINNLLVPPGTAPSSAEVENARIGADGTTYSTLGDAIRDQVGDLQGAFAREVEYTFVSQTVMPTYIQGSVNQITGSVDSSTTNRITGAFVLYNGAKVILPSGMKARVFYYDNPATGTAWYAEPMSIYQRGEIFIPPKHPVARVVIGYDSNADITPDAGSQVSILQYVPTDKTLTVQDKAADASATGTEFATVHKILDKMSDTVEITPAWRQGTINNNGVLQDATTRCRSMALVGYDSAAYIRISIADGYQVSIMEYNAPKAVMENFVQRLFWFTSTAIEFIPTTGYMYRMVLRKSDDSAFTPESLPENCVTVSVYSAKTPNNEGLNFAIDMLDVVAANGDSELIDWEQGSLNISQGTKFDATNRVRSKYYMTYNSLRYLYVYCPEGYKVGVRVYEQSNAATFIKTYPFKSGFWIVEHQDLTMYKLIFGRDDDEDITPAEVPESLKIIPVFNTYWSRDAHGESAATRTTKRCNPTYVAQMVAVAQSYYDHRNDKTNGQYDMVYGYDSAVRQDTYTRQIDCSSYVGLVLRGLHYEDTQYYTKVDTPASSVVANPNYVWAFNPQWYDYYSADLTTEPQDATFASQLGEWMIDMGWRVPKDKKLLNLEVGDIIFYSRMTANGKAIAQPDRFMSINHVAVCVEKRPTTANDPWPASRFPYTHYLMEVTSSTPCVKKRTVETGWDDPSAVGTNNYNTISLICRPDLGSL